MGTLFEQTSYYKPGSTLRQPVLLCGLWVVVQAHQEFSGSQGTEQKIVQERQTVKNLQQ